MKAIADTGFLVAFANRKDRYHEWALALAEQVTDPLLTCEAVIAEASFHLQNAWLVLSMIKEGLIQPALSVNNEMPHLIELAHRYRDRKPDLADRFITHTRARHLAQYCAQMRCLEIAAAQFADFRQDGSPKHVLGLPSGSLTPISVFVFLRNKHLLHEPPHWLGSERVRWIPIQNRYDVVQRGSRLLFVHLFGSTERDALLGRTWGGVVLPVPDLPVL